MKRCRQCRRDYNDDSLSFCLDDGSELLFGPKSEPAAVATGFLGDEPADSDPARDSFAERRSDPCADTQDRADGRFGE